MEEVERGGEEEFDLITDMHNLHTQQHSTLLLNTLIANPVASKQPGSYDEP